MPKVADNYIKLENVVRLRVSNALLIKLKIIATAAGKPISWVIRRQLMGMKIPTQADVIKIDEIRQLKNMVRKNGAMFKHEITNLEKLFRHYDLTGVCDEKLLQDTIRQIKDTANACESAERQTKVLFVKLMNEEKA